MLLCFCAGSKLLFACLLRVHFRAHILVLQREEGVQSAARMIYLCSFSIFVCDVERTKERIV
jgi:hypothetical protein